MYIAIVIELLNNRKIDKRKSICSTINQRWLSIYAYIASKANGIEQQEDPEIPNRQTLMTCEL